MKILQVSPAFYPALSIGGPIFAVLEFTRAIAKKNEVVTLTTPLGLDSSQISALQFDTKTSFADAGEVMYKRYIGYPNLTFSFSSLTWLLNNISRYDLVVLQGVWNFPIWAAALICRLFKTPYVIFPHGTLYRETVELRSGFYKRLMLKLFVRRALERSKAIIFTSSDEATKVGGYIGGQLSAFVVPNIVDSSEFNSLPARGYFRAKYGLSLSTKIVIHFGRITKKKGIEFSIRAVVALRKRGHDVVLMVVGGDSEGYGVVLNKVIDDLNAHDSVIFTGMVDREEGKKALIDADIFALPSYSENFGMAVVEAMLCRLPVVISNNVGISNEVFKAGAGVVVKLDEDSIELTAALESLLVNDEYRSTIANRGRDFAVKTYDVPAVENRIQELLDFAVR
jgi:glycosyltransferase involved in cell wall biosynthesis